MQTSTSQIFTETQAQDLPPLAPEWVFIDEWHGDPPPFEDLDHAIYWSRGDDYLDGLVRLRGGYHPLFPLLLEAPPITAPFSSPIALLGQNVLTWFDIHAGIYGWDDDDAEGAP